MIVQALLVLLLFGTAVHAETTPTEAIIQVPYANVWSKTVTDPDMLMDGDRETQLLQGEKVLIKETSGEWIKIEAIEQPEYTHNNKWEGYPGWIHFSVLQRPSIPAKNTDDVKDPVKFAASLRGTPYLWGGLTKEGIDCSGLTHLSYRNSRRVIPRDSHEQWMKARALQPNEMKPGDLIFSGKPGEPVKITHVTMFAGNGAIIEAPQTGMSVRKISFEKKYGTSLSKTHNGSVVGDRVLYFGTFRD